MEESKEEIYEVKPFFAKCAVIQAITVAIILISVLAIKYLSPKYCRKIQKWYNKNVTVDTSVTEVLGDKNEV